MYIDSHCHLDLITETNISIKNILQNATSFKISKIIHVSASLYDFKNFFQHIINLILNKNDIEMPDLFFTFGASPNDLVEENFDFLKLKSFFYSFNEKGNNLIELIENKKLIAIGEIGLDYFHKFFNKEQQITAFENQIELAKEINLPIMLHIRDAFDDAIEILINSNLTKPIIFHCYSGDKKITEKILSILKNSYFSFAGNITYKKMDFLKESALIIPKNRILLETDAPFLSPIPYRGKTNLPEYVIETYKFISNLLQISLNDLSKQIEENFNKVFELN